MQTSVHDLFLFEGGDVRTGFLQTEDKHEAPNYCPFINGWYLISCLSSEIILMTPLTGRLVQNYYQHLQLILSDQWSFLGAPLEFMSILFNFVYMFSVEDVFSR